MLEFSDSSIKNIAVHGVGNKHREEPLSFSSVEPTLSDDTLNFLKLFFFSSFKDDHYFRFAVEDTEASKDIMYIAGEMFGKSGNFMELSQRAAKQLYDKSDQANIKSGELYVVYFQNLAVEDVVCDAVGFFKSENRETFLKVYQIGGSYNIKHDNGININKLDKGCIVFNVEKEDGYRILAIDKSSKGKEAAFWHREFLGLEQREDKFYQTGSYMDMCLGFAKDVYGPQNNVERPDQIELLNRTSNYFKENENFKLNEFEEKVIGSPDVVQAFNEYKEYYQRENDTELSTEFEISQSAVKQGRAKFKSILKLDKNFHIYVHGKREYIVKGYDEETGLHFYQLYYKQEN